MKYIKKFNEAIREVSMIDTLNELKPYFNTQGVYTEKSLGTQLSGNRLYIELDVTSAYKGGKSERDRIKRTLTRAGFSAIGGSTYVVEINDNDLETVRNIIN